ncbi:unnamed protein product [Boreogadus saida]
MMKTTGEEHRLPNHITQHLEHLLSGQQDAKTDKAHYKFLLGRSPRKVATALLISRLDRPDGMQSARLARHTPRPAQGHRLE